MLERLGASMRRHFARPGRARARLPHAPESRGQRRRIARRAAPRPYLVTASEAAEADLWAACLTALAALCASLAVPVATSEATCSVPVAAGDAPLAMAWPVALAACLTALAALAGAVAPSAAEAMETAPIRAAAIERVRKFMMDSSFGGQTNAQVQCDTPPRPGMPAINAKQSRSVDRAIPC